RGRPAMKTAEALSRKLETLGDLRDVTRTMKALSSSSVRQYEHAVDALGDYYRTVELGLQVVLRHLPAAPSTPRSVPRPERLAAVVFGTDYGLCGRFNHVLCDHAVAHLDARGLPPENRLLLAVGGKAAGCLEQAGQSVQECLFTPGSAEGITETVSSILLTIDAWKAEHGAEQVWLYYNRHAGKARYQPESLHLLPVDACRFRDAEKAAWPSKVLPTFSMDAEALLSTLVRQYLFVALFRACAESLASEHNARLVAMQAAGKNIDEAIEETRTEHRRLRQELITAEILDVVTGYEASSGNPG
ncbi:MAG: F0F1 ATP synthase subunit gamma, partial [Thiobacillus sp.]